VTITAHEPAGAANPHTRLHMTLRRFLWPVGVLAVALDPLMLLGRVLCFLPALKRQYDQAVNVDQWILENEWL
jgi:hypothetical protein